MRSRITPFVTLMAVLSLPHGVQAQPTYKLDVKPDLRPFAVLQLDGKQMVRSDVCDDPGFRMQYHIRQNAKSIATIEARAQKKVDLPKLDPGVYTVTLELFYPAYKGGTAQKGEFKAISTAMTIRVESANKIVEVNPPPGLALRTALGMGIRARK